MALPLLQRPLLLKLLIDSDSYLQAQPTRQTSQISKRRRYQWKASSLVFENTNKQINKTNMGYYLVLNSLASCESLEIERLFF